MVDFLYGVLFATSGLGVVTVLLCFLLERVRKPAFSTGLSSMLVMFLVLLGIACRNAKSSDMLMWSLTSATIFVIWAGCIASAYYILHFRPARRQK